MKLSRPAEQEPVNLDDVDLVNAKLYGEGDPHAIWHAMRERDPVHWQQVGPDLGFFSVTKFEDVSRVLRDFKSFTSQHGTLLNLLGKEDPASGQQLPATDPPRHTKMRAPIQRALNSRILQTHQESIRAEVRRLLSTIVDGEVFDFAALTGAIPMIVTGTLMGLDREEWPRLTLLTSQSIAPDDPEYVGRGGGKVTLEQAHRAMFAVFQDTVNRRTQEEPGDDLIGLLLTMEMEDGRGLHPGEIVSNCYSLLLGANVTTPHVPNAAIIELMRDGTYEEWSTQPALLEGGIEEALRWASPASHFMRYAKCDLELSGVTIPAGQPVAAWLGSANRDENAFPNPYRFDLHRRRNHHLAFGVGPHYCVGHAVARTSLRVFFEELFADFEYFEPAGEVEHLHSNFIAGIKHMPLVATRRSRHIGRQQPRRSCATVAGPTAEETA